MAGERAEERAEERADGDPDEALFEGEVNEAGVREPGSADLRVQVRLFLGIGAFFAVAAVVYWVTSYENAGTTMLALAAGLAALSGSYLWVQDRKLGRPDAGRDEDPGHGAAGPERGSDGEAEHYSPHASIWPFGVGVAAFLVTNGLILGTWFLVPGLMLMAVSVTGYSRQSRRRD